MRRSLDTTEAQGTYEETGTLPAKIRHVIGFVRHKFLKKIDSSCHEMNFRYDEINQRFT